METLSNHSHHYQKERNDDELKFYKSIYTSSGEGIFLTRLNGDILSANPAACRLLERSEDDIISVGRNGVINTEDPRLPGMLKERAQNGFVKGELTFKKRDGSLFPVDFTSNVFEFAPGDFRTVIIFRDISEQKHSEELLKASEEKYRRLFDNAIIGVFVTSLEGNFLYVNRAFADIYETESIDSFINLSVAQIYTNPEMREQYIEQLRRDKYLKNIGNSIITFKNNIKDVIVSVIIDDDKLIGFVADNSERAALMNQLRSKNEKLLRLNRTKDRFFSIISHDLRTPFSSILGFSEILSSEITELSHDDIKDYANNIYLSSRSTYELLENLLIWARSHNGDIRMNITRVNISNVINEVASVMSQTARIKGITVINETDDNIFVCADMNSIKVVVRNLISNAIKYTSEGGLVKVSTQIIRDKVIVSVKDTGKGISEVVLSTLFSENDNISEPGTANETGTGLGLILCKEFIDLNRGEIWAQSSPGEGSTFSFALPLCRD